MIIDTHCHLDDKQYIDDLGDVIQRAKENKVEKFIIPGADTDTLQRAVEISEKYKEVYFAVGVHPYNIDEYNRDSLKEFSEHPKCIAIGECGLDYYRLPKEENEANTIKEAQKKVFADQIIWAKELRKPLIVHIREASTDALEMLELHAGEEGGVLHCYNADEPLLKLSQKNFYYGIGGVLTFKNAKKLINIYPKIPKDRILVETDAPYLAPHPHRGERNEPGHTRFVVEKMAQLSNATYEQISQISTKNAYRLFTFK